MVLRRTVVGAFLALCLVLPTLGTAPAAAGGVGKWSRVTDTNGSNTDEAALLRTSDGILHVIWLRHGPVGQVGQDDIVHTGIGADGAVGSSVDIQTDWLGLSDPDIVATPDGGMRVFFGGIRTEDAGEPNDNLNTSTAPIQGDPWTLLPGNVAEADSAYASEMGAGTSLDGTPFVSWGGTLLHRGLDPNTPNFNYQDTISDPSLCCGYEPDIGTDAVSGQMYVAWASNASDAVGIWAHEIDLATGAPLGSPMLMPNVLKNFNGADSFIQEIARVPITGRVGAPGVYVAYHGSYPSANKLVLWRIGDAEATVVKKTDAPVTLDDVAIAAAPDGRLWLLYTRVSNGKLRVFATRSNTDVTKFGSTVYVGTPKDTENIWHMAANSQLDRVDVVASLSRNNTLAHWHTQIFPGLTLKASPQSFKGKTR